MANETETAAKQEAAPKFKLSDLRERSGDFLGFDPHIVDGAFLGVGQTREFTVAEAKDRIRKWLKTPQTAADQKKE